MGIKAEGKITEFRLPDFDNIEDAREDEMTQEDEEMEKRAQDALEFQEISYDAMRGKLVDIKQVLDSRRSEIEHIKHRKVLAGKAAIRLSLANVFGNISHENDVDRAA